MKQPLEYLKHIRDECRYLMKTSKGKTFDDLMEDETLQRAFVRSIQIIGDATKMIPDEFRENHPKIDWKKTAGMRDVIVHDYLGVDYRIVWDVISNHIPALYDRILAILGSNPDTGQGG